MRDTDNKFSVEIRKEKFARLEKYALSVTHNGYQFTSIGFDSIEELEILTQKLLDFLVIEKRKQETLNNQLNQDYADEFVRNFNKEQKNGPK